MNSLPRPRSAHKLSAKSYTDESEESYLGRVSWIIDVPLKLISDDNIIDSDI